MEMSKLPGVTPTVSQARSEPAGFFRPCGDVGPVPRGSAADRPPRLGEDAAVPPLVDGVALDVEAFGDLGESYGVGLHDGDCKESLDTSQGL